MTTAQQFREQIKEKIVTTLRDNLKGDESNFVNPYAADKNTVVQESKAFNETPVDIVKCCKLITQIIYLINQGEEFSPKETTDIFFGCSKLFSSSSARLRRLVFLIIKCLQPSEMEIFMVTGALQKDINGKNDCFRANAIRTLAKIIDPSMAAQIDRYLKTAIVDKNTFVASSALMCGISLMKSCPDVVRRWIGEVQETSTSQNLMVQYHSVALLYEIKKSDRLALNKVVTTLARSNMKNPMAESLLVRMTLSCLISETDPAIERPLIAYLDQCLRHKSETVTYEAARSLAKLAILEEGNAGSTVRGYDFMHAITILQIFLTSPKPVIRFAAIRTLNELAVKRPQVVARCNCDMEPLMTDTNRSTATLALTTLLKTGHESNVDRLVKQISTFMTDISDIFKIEVVRAVKTLCLTYPAKFKVLMGFLSQNLREEGSNEFKTELVDAVITIMQTLPPTREVGLPHLCEFIEDCEYPVLCQRILGFLAEMVPTTATPAKYVRFIYNRLILENAIVRGASVDALAKIAMKCKDLRKDILLLLESGENDNDDEVRDRIFLYRSAILGCEKEANDGSEEIFGELCSTDLPFSVDAMFYSLSAHINDANNHNTLFDVTKLPTEEQYKIQTESVQVKSEDPDKEKLKSKMGGGAVGGSAEERAAKAAKANEELINTLNSAVAKEMLGKFDFSSPSVPLTESEAEYTVTLIKHMFEHYIALEFVVTNTIEGVILENVQMKLSGYDQLREAGALAISSLSYKQSASAYIVIQKAQGQLVTSGQFTATLHFLMKEDADDMGFDDDYPVEGFSIETRDYVFPRALPQGQHKAQWDALGTSGSEALTKLALSYKSLEQAVEGIIQVLNLQACDDTATADPDKRSHILLLSGVFVGGVSVLVTAVIGMDPARGCLMKLQARSNNEAVSQSIAKAFE